MSCEKYLVVVILAAAVTVVFAKPSGIDLSKAKDRTICKTVVDYDIDDSRVPRVIKVLKCAADGEQDKECPAAGGGGGKTQCCGRERSALDAPLFQCTEVMDSVVVSDKTGMYRINVPIGCACLRQVSESATPT